MDEWTFLSGDALLQSRTFNSLGWDNVNAEVTDGSSDEKKQQSLRRRTRQRVLGYQGL